MSTQEKLEEILDGIDKTEIEYENGWWETSTGAEFGAKKKQELTQLIDSAKREVLEQIRPPQATIDSMKLTQPHKYRGVEYPCCSICGYCPEAINAFIDSQEVEYNIRYLQDEGLYPLGRIEVKVTYEESE